METGRSQRMEYRVVVLGKVGSGKSTVCNKLLTGTGQGYFPVFNGMADQTTEFRSGRAEVDNKQIEVVDSPDVFNMGYTEHEAKAKFNAWRESVNWDVATIFVLTVCLKVRFTPDDNKLYKQYLDLLPDRWSKSIIVAFTFADDYDDCIKEQVECSPAKVLPGVADDVYLVFSNNDSNQIFEHPLEFILRQIDSYIRSDNRGGVQFIPKQNVPIFSRIKKVLHKLFHTAVTAVKNMSAPKRFLGVAVVAIIAIVMAMVASCNMPGAHSPVKNADTENTT